MSKPAVFRILAFITCIALSVYYVFTVLQYPTDGLLETIHGGLENDQRSRYSGYKPTEGSNINIEQSGGDIHKKTIKDQKVQQDVNTEDVDNNEYIENYDNNDIDQDIEEDDSDTYQDIEEDDSDTYQDIEEDDSDTYQDIEEDDSDTYQDIEEDDRDTYQDIEEDDSDTYQDIEEDDSDTYQDIEEDDSDTYQDIEEDDSDTYQDIEEDDRDTYQDIEEDDSDTYQDIEEDDSDTYERLIHAEENEADPDVISDDIFIGQEVQRDDTTQDGSTENSEIFRDLKPTESSNIYMDAPTDDRALSLKNVVFIMADDMRPQLGLLFSYLVTYMYMYTHCLINLLLEILSYMMYTVY